MKKSPINYQLRTAVHADLGSLHAVFEASVRHTCRKDYTEEQLLAWIQKATPERWKELFGSDLHFILMENPATKAVAGFASISAAGYLHSLFVHPDCQHRGIGTSLLQVAEAFVRTHGADAVHSEVSKTARPLFEANGYQVEKEQTVLVGQVEMNNFVMRKNIPAITMKATITIPSMEDYDEMLQLWEASVRSTHHFLREEDILFYKPMIKEQYFPVTDLYIIRSKEGRIVAFLGLSKELVEMLFVDPDEQGKGYGKQLIAFALHEKHIYKVDVNEQNEKALAFYLHRGFQVTGREATDPSGNPFPILHMEFTSPLICEEV